MGASHPPLHEVRAPFYVGTREVAPFVVLGIFLNEFTQRQSEVCVWNWFWKSSEQMFVL